MTDVIEESLKALRKARDEKQEELNRINTAIAALVGAMPNIASSNDTSDGSPNALPISPTSSRPNNTEMVRSVLKDKESGVLFADIIDLVATRYGGYKIKKTSLSPLLTKLRKRGEIKQVDSKWFWKTHAPESSQISFETHDVASKLMREPVYYGGGNSE